MCSMADIPLMYSLWFTKAIIHECSSSIEIQILSLDSSFICNCIVNFHALACLSVHQKSSPSHLFPLSWSLCHVLSFPPLSMTHGPVIPTYHPEPINMKRLSNSFWSREIIQDRYEKDDILKTRHPNKIMPGHLVHSYQVYTGLWYCWCETTQNLVQCKYARSEWWIVPSTRPQPIPSINSRMVWQQVGNILGRNTFEWIDCKAEGCIETGSENVHQIWCWVTSRWKW